MRVVHLHQRVAVGRGLLRGLDGDEAVGAGAILDDHLLAPKLGELVANDAQHGIGPAAGGKRRDYANGLGRILLRGRNTGNDCQAGSDSKSRQCFHAHAFLLESLAAYDCSAGPTVKRMLPTPSTRPSSLSPATTGPTPSGVPVKMRSPGAR